MSLSPLTAPELKSDDDVLPFCGVITYGGAQNCGSKIPVNVQVFLKKTNHFPVPVLLLKNKW